MEQKIGEREPDNGTRARQRDQGPTLGDRSPYKVEGGRRTSREEGGDEEGSRVDPWDLLPSPQ